jgi:DNA repair protein RadC
MTTLENISEINLYYKPKIAAKPKIKCSRDAFANALKFYDHNTIALQEQFIILYLNRAKAIFGVY